MKKATTFKRLLSILLSFVVLVSTMANALSVFATNIAALGSPIYTVEFSKPAISDDSSEFITDTTEDSKTIQDNLLYNKTPVLEGQQKGKLTSFVNGNLPRVNDGKYYATSKENCDIGGVYFVTEPYTYNEAGGVAGGKYVNGWDPETRTYDENAVDTYATFSYSLDDIYDITDFWMFSEADPNLQTGVYEVYTSLERRSLYNPENLKYTYINTADEGWAQKVHFNKTSAAKYIGVKVIMGVTKTTWETPYSYMRIIEIAAFGNESKETSVARNFIETVDFSNIEIADSFWSGRQDQTLLVSFDHAAEEFKTVGAIRNFETAGKVYADARAASGEGATEEQVLQKVKELYTDTGKYPAYGGNFASDSDVYKVMEGMAYAIENYKDSEDPDIQAGVDKIRQYLNDWTVLIEKAQGNDGYLNTLFTIYHEPFDWAPDTTPTGRFQNRAMHELYCLGHLYEAAVAIYNATSDTRLLDVSKKSLDMIYSVFIEKDHPTYTATFTAPGHEEIELALVKLAATVYGMETYGPEYAEKCIELAQYYLDTNTKQNGSDLNGNTPAYLPVSQITEAWGHCVRAFYLYTGMAELSIAKGELLYSNLETLWENVETKTYVTGGIGHRAYTEGLPESYELPNDEDLAYCETCASISNVFWNKSMFKIFGESKYFDNIEKQLYNNVLSGVGLNGTSFNYTNNLETIEGYLRDTWKGTPCCPTNLVRLINKLSEYIYATDEVNNTAYVNLYIGSNGSFKLGNTAIGVNMTSSMPWEGIATLNLSLDEAKEFTLKLRLPAWADGKNSLKVNGEIYTATAGEDGYVAITREWNDGDVIEINFPMSVQYVRNGDVIPTNKGLVAITRGPITYCVEQQDSVTELDLICINEEYSNFSPKVVTDFVDDNTYHTAELQVLNVKSKDIYKNDISFRMIPYYAWSNRGKDAMKVYLSDGSQPYDSWDSDKSIEGNAKPSATVTANDSPVTKLNDGDRNYNSRWASWLGGLPYDSKNPIVTYDFGQNLVKLQSSNIYFYSDGGGCQLPETVDIEYWNGTDWVGVAVTNTPEMVLQDDYSNSNNALEQVYLVTYTFEEITTNKIRVKPSSSDSAIAITEWELTGERVVSASAVTLNIDTLSLSTGASETLIATVSPDNATNKTVKWESSDASVATVDNNGKVTALKQGTATITVTTEDGVFTATCDVSVNCSHTNNTVHPAVASTCQVQGNDEYTTCNDCGEVISGSDAKLPLADHTYTEKAESQYLKSTATCKAKAVYYKSCSVCGIKGIETFEYGKVNPENHTGSTYLKDQKEATCNEEGYTGDTYCSDCDVKIKDGTAIEKSAHNPASVWSTNETDHWKECTVGCGNLIDKAPHTGGEATCTSQAICSVCGVKYGEKNPANHTGGTEIKDALEANCNTEGYTGDTYCKGCGVKIADGKSIAKIPHVVTEWTVTKEATTESTGTKSGKCNGCGETITVTTAKLVSEIKKDNIAGIDAEIEGIGETNLSEDVIFEANNVTETITAPEKTKVENSIKALTEFANHKIGAIFDLGLILRETADNGDVIAETKLVLTGTVKVTIPVPTALTENLTNLKLLHIKDDGTVKEVPFTLAGGKATFETDGFSYYTFVGTENIENGETNNQTPSDNDTLSNNQTPSGNVTDKSPATGDNSNLLLWIAVMFVSVSALAALCIINKKKKQSR